MKVIAFIGRKKSGKTTSICTMIQNQSGKRVFVFKHINEPEFEIDREGTDTWKMHNSGADLIVASSTAKLAIIAKMDDIVDPLQMIEVLKNIVGMPDLVLIEGFHKKVGKDRRVYKVLLTRTISDLEELLSILSEPIVAVVVNGISKDEVKNIVPGKPIFDITEVNELVRFLDSLPENF